MRPTESSPTKYVVDTPALRELEEIVLALPPKERSRLLAYGAAILSDSVPQAAVARLSTPEAFDEALRSRTDVAARSLAVVVYAAHDPLEALDGLERILQAEYAASAPGSPGVADRHMAESPGSTASQMLRRLASFLPWRTVLDLMEAGDFRMIDRWPAFPDAPEEQAEMMSRLLGKANKPNVAAVLARLVAKVEPTPVVEEALLRVYGRADREHFVNDARARAAGKLVAIGTKTALEPLIRRLNARLASGGDLFGPDQFADWKHPIEAIERASSDLIATAKEYTAPERIKNAALRQLGQEVLFKAWHSKRRTPDTNEAWATFLASLWGSPYAMWARGCMAVLPEALVVSKLREHLGPPRVAKAAPASPKWLARYKNGEHEAVWREMRDLGPNAFDVDEVAAVARETMTRVRSEIARLGDLLAQGKYRFHAKKKWHLPPTETTADEVIKIEKKLKLRLPVALRAFHEIVGSVDLTEVYDDSLVFDEKEDGYDARVLTKAGPFAGLGRFDPLEVIALKDMVTTSKPYVNVGPAKGPPELRPVPQLCFGVSPECKHTDEDPDPMYRVELRFYGADAPVLQDARPPIEFVDYLRAMLGAGGFRALEGRNTAREVKQREALTKQAIRF